jgi:23S rRNA pseudouridine1911/1915/1917 synthase
MRLDSYLAQTHPEHSRAVWQKFIKLGRVMVDGVTEENTARAVDDSNFIKFDPPLTPDFTDQKLPIIYEDDNVLVINKPAGVLSHSKGALSDEFTVADFVRGRPGYNFETTTNRTALVHRLDRLTSGVMIAAKNEPARSYLQRQFSDRRAKKTYYAIVDGRPKQNEFRIDLPIARNPKKPATFRVDSNGKPAVTDVKLYKVLPGHQALLELKPLTGRTHQLRVHLAYVGTPVAGDPIYNNSQDNTNSLQGQSLMLQSLM